MIKSFVIYNEIFRLIDTITPVTKRDEFLGILMDFYFKDKKPNFEPNSYEEIIWENISKPIKSYKSKVANGLRGGRPKKTENETESKSESESKTQSESKTTTVVNVYVNVYVYIENNFNITISGTNYENIADWLKIYDEEIIKYAVDLCVAKGKRTMNYLFGILKNWKSCDYKTLNDIKEKSNIPEWFDKSIKQEKTNEEEEETLKQILKKYD